jgi:hypothetical protein
VTQRFGRESAKAVAGDVCRAFLVYLWHKELIYFAATVRCRTQTSLYVDWILVFCNRCETRAQRLSLSHTPLWSLVRTHHFTVHRCRKTSTARLPLIVRQRQASLC